MAYSSWSTLALQWGTAGIHPCRCFKLAPLSSKRPKWESITISILECILGKLDCNKLLDIAVAGCITTIFYSVLSTAEFTQKTLNSFDPAMHIKPLNITHKTDQNNLHVMVFMLPKTKCSDEPEDTYWSRQDGISIITSQSIPHHQMACFLPTNTQKDISHSPEGPSWTG